MAFLKIKHGDITKMSMDEMRELKFKWNKMNKAAITICTYYLVPIFFVSVSTTVRLILQLFRLSIDYNMLENLLPLLLLIGLVLALVQMKYENIKGHIVTLLLYLLVLLTFDSRKISLLSCITYLIILTPIFLVLRCIINYKMLLALKKMPGYPTFFYTVSSKLAHEIYLKNENQDEKQDVKILEKLSKEYIPWNAFDEEIDKNKEKGANAGDENCIEEEGNDF